MYWHRACCRVELAQLLVHVEDGATVRRHRVDPHQRASSRLLDHPGEVGSPTLIVPWPHRLLADESSSC